MKSNVQRIKSPAVCDAPQTRDHVIEQIALIGAHQRERQKIQASMNDELSAVREKWETKAAPHADEIKRLATGVQGWCEANREDLTQGGKRKTVELASGSVKWRMRPPSCVVRGADKVIETLKRLGLECFVRVKEEIAKDLILAEPEAVKGVRGITITQKEDFVIVPFETELEELA